MIININSKATGRVDVVWNDIIIEEQITLGTAYAWADVMEEFGTHLSGEVDITEVDMVAQEVIDNKPELIEELIESGYFGVSCDIEQPNAEQLVERMFSNLADEWTIQIPDVIDVG